MKGYSSNQIKNVVLLGHGGSGKTTIVEAALAQTGVITRMGKVENGNTVSDYEKTEIEKGYSISLSLIPVEYNKTKINFLDTPGFFDFVGEVCSAVRAAEAAVIVVDASAGIQVGTEKAWATCKNNNLPRIFLINKTDKENVDVGQVIADLKQKFGTSVAALDDRDSLNEAVAETDEELLEKFLGGEDFTEDEFAKGLAAGVKGGDISPIVTASAIKQEGIKEFLDVLLKYVPSPVEHPAYPATDAKGEETKITPDPAGPLSAFVFKTIADPIIGKISLIKVISGKIVHGGEVVNTTQEKPEKMGATFFLRGKTQVEASEVEAGDIFAATKLQFARTGDTFTDKSRQIKFPAVDSPEPSLFIAIEPKTKGEDEKVSSGLGKLRSEDPSFSITRSAETAQTLLGGQGEIQIGIITTKLKERYGVDVTVTDVKVPYRETIKGTADVQGKHKKQSGGAGQYGDVHIKFSPTSEDFEFAEELFGGSVPKQYVPAVEKGLRESLSKGPLSGNRVTGIRAVLYDGSYHDVDSNEMAFKIAASLAFKKGIEEAKPILLEPVMHVEILVPDEFTGDVMGDMNKRRGKILGMEPQTGGGQKLLAEAPQAELFKYAINLRSMTQARGSFTMTFERYEEVPANLAQRIIAEHKAAVEAEHQ
ncbi:MAG: elongation factor G [Clostridiales Family XIII bacterium]|jgi:elongation factor G|nr:elongation factor G [Clostridiales Family XIII bacterium]